MAESLAESAGQQSNWGAFLEIDAPGGGHNPTVPDGEHMGRTIADPAPL